jgi:hypothetical protein
VIHKADVPGERLTAWRDDFTIPPSYEDDDLLVYRTRPVLGRDFTAKRALGGNLALVQASVTPTHTTQGGMVWVDLRWTATYTPTSSYAARLALVNPAGEIVQEQTAPLCSDWPTSHWGRHALVVDQRHIQVDPHLPPSMYRVTLSVVEPEIGKALPPTRAIATLEVSALERQFTAPPVQYTTAVTFGNAMALLGYDLHQEASTLHLTLHWQALRRLDYYKVFVHLYDKQSGDLVVQSDAVPRQWTYPTNWWEAGEVVSDEIVLDLSEMASGRYRLAVGVYEPDSGMRLTLPSSRDQLNLEEDIQIP